MKVSSTQALGRPSTRSKDHVIEGTLHTKGKEWAQIQQEHLWHNRKINNDQVDTTW
jgi:hypothetical protein